MAQKKQGSEAYKHLAVAGVVGIISTIAIQVFANWHLAIVGGWAVGAATLIIQIWAHAAKRDDKDTQKHANNEDPGRGVSDILLLTASLASLLAIILLLSQASQLSGGAKLANIAVGLLGIIMSWTLVHTLFTLKYARLYYSDPVGGIDFNGDKPNYKDFAYLSFTIGMTFQVSDTALKNKAIRSLALRQALLSYVFGTIIIASTINIIAGLSK